MNMVNQAAVRAAMEGAKGVAMKHLEYSRDKIIMGKCQSIFLNSLKPDSAGSQSI